MLTCLLMSPLALAGRLPHGPAPLAAGTPVTVRVTIVSPPPCVINGNNTIDVNFGDQVVTSLVDGSYAAMQVPYTLVCTGLTRHDLTMTLSGQATGFDKAALNVTGSNAGTLGVHVSQGQGGTPVSINTPLAFTYNSPSDKPDLWAVLVKKTGTSLQGGAFSAGATLSVAYP